MAWSVGAAISVRMITAGAGISNGDGATGTHQQSGYEHANAYNYAQMRRNHDLLPTSHRTARHNIRRHCRKPDRRGQRYALIRHAA